MCGGCEGEGRVVQRGKCRATCSEVGVKDEQVRVLQGRARARRADRAVGGGPSGVTRHDAGFLVVADPLRVGEGTRVSLVRPRSRARGARRAREREGRAFSKKLVLPSIEMRSIKSNGFSAPYSLALPSETRRRSATNSMYWHMSSAFMPMRRTGSASVRNSCSISTASRMMRSTVSGCGRRSRCEKRRQAKSVWRPSSREMSSFCRVAERQWKSYERE